MIPISRANNVSIMLTQFSNFRRGPQDIRKALVTGTGLSLERLSLLLQVLQAHSENGNCHEYYRTVLWSCHDGALRNLSHMWVTFTAFLRSSFMLDALSGPFRWLLQAECIQVALCG